MLNPSMRFPHHAPVSTTLKWIVGAIIAAAALWTTATWLVLGLAYTGWIG